MGRSGVLPAALGKVNPKRKTPVNAIHLEVAVQVVAFVCVLIWGVENVFFTWANAITIGLVLMYILANIGVVKYYLTEARDKFNPWLHVVVPVVASAAGVVVVWKSYFSPFTSSGPVYWGLLVFYRGAGAHHPRPHLPAGARPGGLDAQGPAGIRAVGKRSLGQVAGAVRPGVKSYAVLVPGFCRWAALPPQRRSCRIPLSRCTPPRGGFGDSEKPLAYLHQPMVNRSRLLLRTAW